jgi:hypothetical protein
MDEQQRRTTAVLRRTSGSLAAPPVPVQRYAPLMSPSLAVELARLLVLGASPEAVAGCLARASGAPSLESVLALGERARAAGSSEEETALALGLLRVLGVSLPPESAGP